MFEYHFQCPHCWETISMLLDPSVGHQKYIEDCEVCCNPIEIDVTVEDGILTQFSANGIDQ